MAIIETSQLNQETPENKTVYAKFDWNYQNQEWWVQMKTRMAHKTEGQLLLDKTLIEVVNAEDEIDLDRIEELLRKGAKIDHWKIDGSSNYRLNAFMVAARSPAENATEAVKILIKRFPNFMTRDTGMMESPVGRAIFTNNLPMVDAILSQHKVENPLFSFMINAKGWSNEDKKVMLQTIDKYYKFKIVFDADFMRLRQENRLGPRDVDVRENVAQMFRYCRSKSPTFLDDVVGKSHMVDDPIAWRYKGACQNYTWLVQDLEKLGFNTGEIRIKKQGNDFQVLIINAKVTGYKIWYFTILV